MYFHRITLPCFIALLAVAVLNAASADQSGSATLAPSTFLNLDTGVASAAGGDILWNGLTLTPQGRAGLYNLGKYGSRVFKSIRAKSASSVQYGSAAIPAGKLVAGDVFGVHTNGGHYAKLMVTANESGSLSLEYTTFIATRPAALTPAASSEPSITQLQNNYSYLLPGAPNYGIAPGSLFVIVGTGLSNDAPPVLQSSAAPGLPTTLNQSSVSVTVKGVTTTPALYYTSATQLAAVLPSTTPVGSGTLTVTYNGQTSNAAPIQVVASAVGLDTLYGTGNGAGVATDANGNSFGLTNSAMPGQTIILWGSGIGADTANDDRTYPQTQDNLTSVPTQILIGGISATISYRGRSQYPGLDQFDVVIPTNVSPGCFVSVVVQTGSVVSNTVTIPVSPNGGACSDPGSGLNGTQIAAVANKSGGKANIVAIAISQTTEGGGTSSSAFVLAGTLASADFGKGYEYASQGSCTVVPPEQGSLFNQLSALNAGTIQMTGPTGQVQLGEQGPGFYQSQISSSGGAPAGTYTFTGSGADIGSFTTSINLQSPLALTNANSLSIIDRTQDTTVTWSGGFTNSDVQVEGAVGDQYGTIRFYCHAPSSAGQFTIPSSILLALPPGPGSFVVTNTTAPQTISASGIDVGMLLGTAAVRLNPTFK